MPVGRPTGSKNRSTPKKSEEKAEERESNRSLADAKFIALYISAIAIVVYLFLVAHFSGELYGGLDSSHAEGIDYENYAQYLVVLSIIFFASFMLAIYAVSKAEKGSFWATLGITGVIGFFFFFMAIDGLFYARAYGDNASADDIALQTNAGVESATLDLGNSTVLSATVEEYHEKDADSWWYKYLRLITFEDKWRIAVRMNNTAYWNETGQNLTGSTARIKAYALPTSGSVTYEAFTGWVAPNTQPGTWTYGETKVLVFEDIARNPRVVYFVLEILDSDGTVLGTGYVHPRVELAENAWFMDTAI